MWEVLRWTWEGKQIRWCSFDTGLERIRSTQRTFAAEHGLVCIDVNHVVPKDTALYFDHIHYTEAGSLVVGEAMGEGLLRLLQSGVVRTADGQHSP
jgi:hypothetical protein